MDDVLLPAPPLDPDAALDPITPLDPDAALDPVAALDLGDVAKSSAVIDVEFDPERYRMKYRLTYEGRLQGKVMEAASTQRLVGDGPGLLTKKPD